MPKIKKEDRSLENEWLNPMIVYPFEQKICLTEEFQKNLNNSYSIKSLKI